MNHTDILDFWFGEPDSPAYGQPRIVWFSPSSDFDATIATAFGQVAQDALAGGLRDWDTQGPSGLLARILVLDQFTRNLFRGSPQAFAGDALALEAAQQLRMSGAHLRLPPVQRWFAYMPFEHAEDIAMQELSLSLFTELAREHTGFDEVLVWVRKYHGVIARFGRFPFRNDVLGRESTPAELEFLAQIGN